MATAYARKMDAAVAAVSSLLRGHGFKKQRHRFNAEPEPGMTQVLTFQMGAHQPPGTTEIPGLRENLYGAFTINLGLHFEEVRDLPTRSPAAAFLRERGLPVPPPRPRPKGLGEGDCHVTVRLGELIDGRDTWWTLDLPDDELESLVHELIADYALPFFERFNSREALLDAWHAGDPTARYTPAFTIGVIHARRGDTAEAEELLAAELRESERPAERQQIIDAAEHLGLKRAREVRRHIQYDLDPPV
jgi:Domain of unknown function (DUF4304)